MHQRVLGFLGAKLLDFFQQLRIADLVPVRQHRADEKALALRKQNRQRIHEMRFERVIVKEVLRGLIGCCGIKLPHLYRERGVGFVELLCCAHGNNLLMWGPLAPFFMDNSFIH